MKTKIAFLGVETSALHVMGSLIPRYRTLAHLARTVAREEGALFVERWDSITREFYLSGSVRPHVRGHAIWGSLLAEQLIGAGLV